MSSSPPTATNTVPGARREVFFHPDRERGANRAQRDDSAKQVCRTCPVIAECRRHALAVQEPYGVWGGLTVEERSSLLQLSDHAAPHGLPNPRRERAAEQ
ncbi:MAG TPA: WhiB family transcriptional regulator [Pseudonocardia sp.]